MTEIEQVTGEATKFCCCMAALLFGLRSSAVGGPCKLGAGSFSRQLAFDAQVHGLTLISWACTESSAHCLELTKAFSLGSSLAPPFLVNDDLFLTCMQTCMHWYAATFNLVFL
jgi:hypothetical protein